MFLKTAFSKQALVALAETQDSGAGNEWGRVVQCFKYSTVQFGEVQLLQLHLLTTMGTGRARMNTPIKAHRPPISWGY